MNDGFGKKAVIVFGASGDLGSAVANLLGRNGYRVEGTYHTRTGDMDCLMHQVDVRVRKHVRSLMHEVKQRHDGLHAVINCTGMNRTADWHKQTDKEWDEIIGVNLKGAFIVGQLAGNFLDDGGRLITLGSLSADTGGPRSPAYAAAKSGLDGLMRCLARHLGARGVTVNVVSPGVIDNAMTGATMADWVYAWNIERKLLDRWGNSQDVASAVLYLMQASWVTGQTLRVNGGAAW